MVSPSDSNNATSALSSVENTSRALQPRVVSVHPIAVSPPPAGLTAKPNAVSLLKALRRRLGIALTVGVVFAAIVGAAVWIFQPPPKLTARMMLHVSPMEPRLLFVDHESAHAQNNIFMRNQAVLIRERTTIIAALRDPQIANLPSIKEQTDPEQWIETKMVIEFPSPEFIYISLSGDRPEDLKQIVSAVTKAYMDNYVNKDQIAREAQQKKIRELKAEFKTRLDNYKLQLKKLREQAGGQNEEAMLVVQQLANEELSHAKRNLTDVRHQLLKMRVELGLNPRWESDVWPVYAAALNCQPGPGLPVNQALVSLLRDEYNLTSPKAGGLTESQLTDLINKDPIVADLAARIQLLNKAIDNVKEKAKSPELIKIKSANYVKQLAQVKKEHAERVQSLREFHQARFHQREKDSARQRDDARDKSYRSFVALENELVQTVNRLAANLKQKLNDADALGHLLEDIDESKKVVQKASEKLLAMDVEKDAPPRISQPYKDPIIVNTDAAARKVMITSGSAIAALALVLLAFAWFEFQSRKVHTPDEVVQDLGLQLVGTVPDHSPRGWLPWSRSNDTDKAYTQSMLTESVDSARTLLLHVARQDKLQIVMITSALSGEGKTSLASHLAASLSRAGRRTILVDSDLRNPTLHRLFERDRAPGLSELLRGETDLAAVIGETAIPNLWLIPAGKADHIALQVLSLDVLPKIFERLRLHYDFVIVDSCPVLPVADAMLVGQHVDAVIFSLLRDVSRLPRVHAAYQRLAVLGIRMLGAVVNGAQLDRYPSDYHYVAQQNDEED